jgi:hypothetical protein
MKTAWNFLFQKFIMPYIAVQNAAKLLQIKKFLANITKKRIKKDKLTEFAKLLLVIQ